MRRFSCLLLCLFALCAALPAKAATISETKDTTGTTGTSDDRFQAFYTLLEEFYQSLTFEEVSVKNEEMDRLISSCSDSLMRQSVALKIFDHYRYSRIMGEEAVAVHIFDRWFSEENSVDRVQMRSDFDLMDAQLFANFNRYSLLGMQAPEIRLKKACLGTMTIPRSGHKAVIFFYDTSCAKCRLEIGILPSVLAELNFKIDFYAVYTGENKRDWNAFRKNFKFKNPNIKLFHLWDPEMESEYQRYYSVLGTPRMYFVLEDGEIIGRRLEVTNLQEIINIINITNGTQEETKE